MWHARPGPRAASSLVSRCERLLSLVCHQLASPTCLLGPPAGKPPLSPLHLLAQPFLVLPIRHSEYRVPNLFVLRMCTCFKWLVARGPYKVDIQSSRCQLLIVVGAKWLPNMVWCVRCTSDCVSPRWLLRCWRATDWPLRRRQSAWPIPTRQRTRHRYFGTSSRNRRRRPPSSARPMCQSDEGHAHHTHTHTHTHRVPILPRVGGMRKGRGGAPRASRLSYCASASRRCRRCGRGDAGA